MLANLPPLLTILILAGLGALIGAFINYAIYAWPYFLRRPISPWLTDHETALESRKTSDFFPIIGWFGLRRESKIHGRGFWVRPLLIELVWLVGLPWFYFWQLGGGLTGGFVNPQPVNWTTLAETWFVVQAILIALMFIATFIDFDERTIPDKITIPGTLIGLLLSALMPWMRLPQVMANLGGDVVQPIHFASSQKLPDWQHGIVGLLIAVAIFIVWILALLPKICTLRFGVVRGIKIMVGSCLRPARKTACEIRKTQRGMLPVTALLALLCLIGVVSIVIAKQFLPAENWNSLFGSLIGLAFGGGMVWSIRIVARYVMQREAMGFGDVTLMAMIGAFLGWQSALMTFAMAPFAALVIVFVCFLVTKESELAFGPYLCFGCATLLFGWSQFWPIMARQFFFVGPWLFVILIGGLFAMTGMLVLIQWIKQAFGLGEFEADV